MDVVDVTDLCVRYKQVRALRGVTLQVTEGEVVCILGPNGAGKSTLINVLLGLREPDAGTARLFGGTPQQPAVRGRVGAMLQQEAVPEGLTVREVVQLVGRYYPYRLPVEVVLGQAGLRTVGRKRVAELSGGQRQRLEFALALAGDPDLLLLDEPTVAMDVAGRGAFWDRARALTGLGKTVLFSTHYLTEADEYADRVVVLHHGQVIHDGTAGQLKALVPAKTIHLVTDAPDAVLSAVPGVQHVTATTATSCTPRGTASGVQDVAHGAREVTVHCTRPEAVLARLVHDGAVIDELTVADADLETAFLALTAEETGAAA